MWIVAGPNGAGKTTLVRSGFIQDTIGEALETINPDEIAATIRTADPGIHPLAASRRAAAASDSRVDACIEAGTSFLVETVLSSDKFKARIDRAVARRFSVGLIFIALASPDQAVRRVAQRVAQHGHDVPTEKIRERWPRSIANLRWFADRAIVAYIFDNSEIGRPVLLAEKGPFGWHRYATGRIPAIDAALSAE